MKGETLKVVKSCLGLGLNHCNLHSLVSSLGPEPLLPWLVGAEAQTRRENGPCKNREGSKWPGTAAAARFTRSPQVQFPVASH